MNTGQAWWTLVVLIILASVAKIVPVTLMSKLCSRKPWLYCLSIGVLMNTRGIVQLVVLNIGVELGVLSPKLFAIFVLMATILTFLTSPILYLIYRRRPELERASNVRSSEAARSSAPGELNMTEIHNENGDVATISKPEMDSNDTIMHTRKLSRKMSSKGIINYTFSTLEYPINIAEGESPIVDDEDEETEPVNTMSTYMTRF